MKSQNKSLEEKLFSSLSKRRDPRDTEILFEQYKLYVELMDKISERRIQANSFFLTVNTLLVTALTTILSLADLSDIQYRWMILASFGGIIFSYTWRRLIQSYKELNTGKFRIIHLLETRLPAKLFDAEWDALNKGDGTVYYPFSHVEMTIPIIFFIIYSAMIVLLFVT